MRRLRPQAPIILLTEAEKVSEPTLNLVDALIAKDRFGKPVVARKRTLARMRTHPPG
jgi:hypothetical protein